MKRPQFKLLWVFPSFRVDAATQRFSSLARALGDEYEHLICAMDGDFSAEALLDHTVEWRRLEAPVRKKSFISLGNLWSFRRLLNTERPDLLVSSNWGGVEWLMVNRGPGSIPHVHFEDAMALEERPGTEDPKRSWTRRRAFPGRNRAFVAPSRMVQRLFSRGWGAPAENVHYIPAGVDISRFAAPPRHPNGRNVRIAAVGELTKERRIDRLLRLVAELRRRNRNIAAVIVGDGPERAALTAEAERLGVADRVDFVGEQTNVAPYLAQFDIFAVTSDYEQAPPSLVEAMASGLPVFGTRVGDVGDMVDESNAMFIQDAEDESALTAAAELLVVDGDLRDRLGRANMVRASSQFSLDAMIRRYDALFREMTRKGQPLMLPAPLSTSTALVKTSPAE